MALQEKVGPGEMLVAAQWMEGERPPGQAHSQTPGEEGSGDQGHAQTISDGFIELTLDCGNDGVKQNEEGA